MSVVSTIKPRGKVLVVDDDPIALDIVRERLVGKGYEVVTRTDALGTSTVIAQESPEVVLLDLSMPGLSGERLAKLIAQNPRRRVAIIFHTAKDPRNLDEVVRECGALGAIRKTPDDELFLLQFERLLSSRQPQKPNG